MTGIPGPPEWDDDLIRDTLNVCRPPDYRNVSRWHVGLCRRCPHPVHGAICRVEVMIGRPTTLGVQPTRTSTQPCLCPAPTFEELNGP